jgi:TPR repeat protein
MSPSCADAPRALLLASLALLGSASCRNPSDALREIEADGFENVELTAAGDGFSFKATKAGQPCQGSVVVSKGLFSKSSEITSFCTAETPAAAPEVCSKETPGVCLDRGLSLWKSDKKSEAVTLYTSGCDFDHGPSCTNLGVAYERGQGVAADPKRATTLYEKACTLGSGVGCNNAGITLANAKPPDYARAALRFVDACDKKISDGCNNVAALAVDPAAGKPDEARAYEFYRRSCDLGADESCAYVANRLLAGLGVKKDRPAGLAMLETKCSAGGTQSCTALAFELRNPGPSTDPTRAVKLFTAACEAKVGSACAGLAEMTERGPGGLTRGPAKELFAKACELGEEVACKKSGGPGAGAGQPAKR